jgi:hypothetical protein
MTSHQHWLIRRAGNAPCDGCGEVGEDWYLHFAQVIANERDIPWLCLRCTSAVLRVGTIAHRHPSAVTGLSKLGDVINMWREA